MVVSYRNSTSNHNHWGHHEEVLSLYLIEILHQTTTPPPFSAVLLCCILSKFYIKPQQRTGSESLSERCILSKFYIKPQLREPVPSLRARCILSKFYIKPQQIVQLSRDEIVVSYRNSTSNHNCLINIFHVHRVVSYRNSTSNHNLSVCIMCGPEVVSYRNSTSNHNNARRQWRFQQLYLIEILHQTTTTGISRLNRSGCILSKFYIKPQRDREVKPWSSSCILSKFYIKPQRRASY